MKYVLLLLLLCLIGSASVAQAQPIKRLYIANDDHTDYMWTADEAHYDSAFVQMLDFYLRQIDSTRNDPSDFQARFNCDGSYWLRAYQKYRSPAQFNRLIAAIRSGHISSPLNTLVSTYGAQPTEAVLRGMYYAGSLERAHKLRFTLAQAMENNTIPLGLSALWAGSGAKYSYRGIGGYGSQMTYEYRDNRRHQLYRYAGLDGSSVLMKWYNYNEKTMAPLGGYAECRLYPEKRPADVSQAVEIGRVIDKLDAFCDTLSARSTYPFNVAGAFGYGWDDLATYVSSPFIEAAKKGTTPTRRVRVSNEEDFFADVARSYPNLPAESVSLRQRVGFVLRVDERDDGQSAPVDRKAPRGRGAGHAGRPEKPRFRQPPGRQHPHRPDWSPGPPAGLGIAGDVLGAQLDRRRAGETTGAGNLAG